MKTKDKLIAKSKIKLISQISFYLISLYFSFLLLLGVLIGHGLAWYISEKAHARRFFREIIIPIRKRQNFYLHIHHWIMGLFGLLVYQQLALKYGLNSDFIGHFLIIGFFSGVISQSLLINPDWHRLFKKK